MCEICDLKKKFDAVAARMNLLRQKIHVGTTQFHIALEEGKLEAANIAKEEVLRLTGQSFDDAAEVHALKKQAQEIAANDDPVDRLARIFGSHATH